MEQNIQFISTRHQRMQGEYEFNPSYVLRNVQINRSTDLQRIAVTIEPTLTTKYGKLWETRDMFSGEIVRQNVTSANVLKYIGDDPDYIFHVRNEESIIIPHHGLLPTTSIELQFAEDDELILILERRDMNVKICYYK